jgi:phytoene dehydrogenase-like protein
MMAEATDYDAAIVGSGPNGLAAAIELARNGLKTVVIEAEETAGGGVRSAELTLPGFIHDTGSAVHPMALASPFFKSLPLSAYGLNWILPPVAMAHPFDDGRAALLSTSIDETAGTLGKDGPAYKKLISPIAEKWDTLAGDLLGNMRSSRDRLALLKFGIRAMASARDIIESRFHEQYAAGFFAGLCSHSVVPLENVASAAIGLVLCASGHGLGWPVPAGGSGRLGEALGTYLRSLGGKIEIAQKVRSLTDLPPSGVIFFDTSPRQMADICSGKLPVSYTRSMRKYRYGPGVFKLDWALSGPIPWKADGCSRAGTVHLGGSFAEIATSERAAWQGRVTSRPFVLLSQPSLFDASRVPAGYHIAWAYCHVPNGCNYDMTPYIETQVERFAPGFRELILARHKSSPADLEAGNANLIGGDIVGGAQTLTQIFCRPACRVDPYSTPLDNIYICSASTPPGAGVHGMCGYNAARDYLKRRKK